ncbi:MAG: glycoside hydrolase family 16 protein [Prolixibacteraceae bacterium]|jgi:beta-glucanase (GH16 family)|nr:glycoside hydrolase family 16 protein [Prolixibacteraceae bacterium]MBT6005188.1 glycoside hydrolase family 16 protein [Prolixibacteraceae bacterium]MBT6767120.1 glycoside hydrolase family 16 protein [Prolixibacteraceae bacterium]MBT7000876.1 glycoside hydrolase family 16 protein [Prolixibacteraceae bacterium]MBT7394754.1 glycoside hydrolase family 16 protein [Prolixibacteraceae bacterium]
MKYLFFCVACFIAFTACSKTDDTPEIGKVIVEIEKVEWELVWEDNFDKSGLPDGNIWRYEEGYIRNDEAQYYTKERVENARVEDGNLIIEAHKDNWEGKEITSASLHTYGNKEILYGKVEVRAKLPTGIGTWPAIWMLGNSIRNGTNWPDCGEIDIMENVGFDPDVVHGNVHTKAYNHVLGTNKGNKVTIEKPYDIFHVYTIEWYENRIEFFMDEIRYFVFENENSGYETWPFDKPHYLIINLAIGGGWGGQQGIDNNIFPQKYYIDYVKVFKEKN